jgi:NCAIR mutase (PurE)-related protein
MNPGDLHDLLGAVKDGRVSPEDALERLRALPYEDLGFATLDHHRALRRGAPEVVYGGGKTAEQVAAIVERMAAAGHNVLVTRATEEARDAVLARGLPVEHHPSARCLTLAVRARETLVGRVAIVSAGTSDQPVAEEAAVTATFLGATVDRFFDVGVAGLHRLLGRTEEIRRAKVVVVVAGMEGALPSVVGGLVEAPVIAVPTSVGYGVAEGGRVALHSALASCAPGLLTVNIDNGYGAACAALRVLAGEH